MSPLRQRIKPQALHGTPAADTRCPANGRSAKSRQMAIQHRPSLCAQFLQYALHSLRTLWVGWSKLRIHFEVSQCLLQTVLDLPCNAAGQVGGGVSRLEPDRLVILGN